MKFTIDDIKKVAILFDRDNLHFYISEDNLNSLRETVPGVEIFMAPNETELLKKTTDADMLMVWARNKPATFVKNAPSLKWIHSLLAGYDHLRIPEILEGDFVITNTQGIHANPISEYVLAHILFKLKSLNYMARQQERVLWSKPWSDEVMGKTVAVLGVGNIGKEICRKCKLMGFKVIGYKRHYEEFEYVDELYTDPKDLNLMLSKADFVVDILPGSPSTEHIIGKEQFMAMKKGCYFINVGRGITVDHYALVWALQNGMISGCALDAIDPEPLPASSPLWGFQNVLITPHMAADSPEYMNRAFAKINENFERLKKGEDLKYVVDLKG